MMGLVMAVQVALPLALILWLVWSPGGSLLGFLSRTLGVGVFLLALALVTQWALPVWWLPRVYGVLWLTAVLAGVVRRRHSPLPLMPAGGREWVSAGLGICLLVVGGWYAGKALMGRSPPPVPMVEIANPFGPGEYLVGHGGSNELLNAHTHTLDESVPRFQPWRGQSYAVDFFGLGSLGLRASGWRPVDPAEYAIFGTRLHAPCGGTVIAAESGMPDFRVPEQDLVNRLGNHVILRCGNADIVFAHMRRKSLVVAPGDNVTTGDFLGEVGNSGASTEPHLHIHAQRPAAEGQPPISGQPLGLRIGGRFLVRNDRLTGQQW